MDDDFGCVFQLVTLTLSPLRLVATTPILGIGWMGVLVLWNAVSDFRLPYYVFVLVLLYNLWNFQDP